MYLKDSKSQRDMIVFEKSELARIMPDQNMF
jgi:hypothetical protein